MTLTTSTNTALDREKYLSAKLLSNTMYRLVAATICEKERQPNGTGITAHFVRYKRMYVPTQPLSEGITPSASTFELEEITVTLDQWGDVIKITDVAKLTTKHPVLEQALLLLADNAQRVIDREVQLVWLANPNIQYGDGTVTSRSAITTGMTISDTMLHRVRVTMAMAGAPTRNGPSLGTKAIVQGGTSSPGSLTQGGHYVAITDASVTADIQQTSTNYGTWVATAMYQNAKPLYNGEVGTWLGFRWVETNFIPIFSMYGNTTAAVASGSTFGAGTPTVTASTTGGALAAATHYFKVVRKGLMDGFADEVSIIHSQATTGTTGSVTFAFPATQGYAYDVYFGSANSDASLHLAGSNIAAGESFVVANLPAASGGAPQNVNTTGTPAIHNVYIHGRDSTGWVGLQDLKTYLSSEGIVTEIDPLKQRRTLGYKFMSKAVVKNSLFMMRLEVPSNFSLS